MEAVDPLRLACAVLAPFLVVGMLILGTALKGDRRFGCFALAMFAVAVAWGNVVRIHETATGPTYFAAGGTILGLLYIGRVSVTLTSRTKNGRYE